MPQGLTKLEDIKKPTQLAEETFTHTSSAGQVSATCMQFTDIVSKQLTSVMEEFTEKLNLEEVSAIHHSQDKRDINRI